MDTSSREGVEFKGFASGEDLDNLPDGDYFFEEVSAMRVAAGMARQVAIFKVYKVVDNVERS